MTRKVVVDVSVLIAVFLPDESDPVSFEQLLDEGVQLVSPSIMPTEFANTLLVAARRRRIQSRDLQEFADILGDTPIQIDATTPERSLREVLHLAEATGLTAYDACYLELAIRTGAQLATIDRQLRTVAGANGVRCLPV